DPASPKFAPRSKRSPNEGGIRTPIMLRWPGKLKPQQDEKTLVSTIDLAPTILAACGLPTTKEMTGISLLDSGKEAAERNAVFGEIYEHDVADIDDPEPGLLFRWCVAGDWKLIESADGKSRGLYNVRSDPQEVKDLASEQQQRVRELGGRIKSEWSKHQGPSRN
ncbi:MAG TPA: sulfatase/phosphatase domain-containing protein, partial [Pirellulaceae bacterium]|nr:sulfatase/phosphatase domain-containing protein [Pirellulaceae bacterium]